MTLSNHIVVITVRLAFTKASSLRSHGPPRGMSKPSKNLWYQLGYALETARQHAPAPGKVSKKPDNTDEAPAPSAVDQLLTAGGGVVAHKLISALSGRRPGTLRITRAALAGAGAAFVLSLLRHPNGSAENGTAPDPALELLMGAGRGILYGSLLEPRLPGSPVLRGATFGIMEYVAAPMGGLDGILGAASPHRTMPVLSVLFAADEVPAGSLTHHVAFGAALGLLYGEGRARRGRLDAE